MMIKELKELAVIRWFGVILLVILDVYLKSFIFLIIAAIVFDKLLYLILSIPIVIGIFYLILFLDDY